METGTTTKRNEMKITNAQIIAAAKAAADQNGMTIEDFVVWMLELDEDDG